MNEMNDTKSCFSHKVAKLGHVSGWVVNFLDEESWRLTIKSSSMLDRESVNIYFSCKLINIDIFWKVLFNKNVKPTPSKKKLVSETLNLDLVFW